MAVTNAILETLTAAQALKQRVTVTIVSGSFRGYVTVKGASAFLRMGVRHNAMCIPLAIIKSVEPIPA